MLQRKSSRVLCEQKKHKARLKREEKEENHRGQEPCKMTLGIKHQQGGYPVKEDWVEM